MKLLFRTPVQWEDSGRCVDRCHEMGAATVPSAVATIVTFREGGLPSLLQHRSQSRCRGSRYSACPTVSVRSMSCLPAGPRPRDDDVRTWLARGSFRSVPEVIEVDGASSRRQVCTRSFDGR